MDMRIDPIGTTCFSAKYRTGPKVVMAHGWLSPRAIEALLCHHDQQAVCFVVAKIQYCLYNCKMVVDHDLQAGIYYYILNNDIQYNLY